MVRPLNKELFCDFRKGNVSHNDGGRNITTIAILNLGLNVNFADYSLIVRTFTYICGSENLQCIFSVVVVYHVVIVANDMCS